MTAIYISYLNRPDIEELALTNDEETNLLWHCGLSLSDIALGHAVLAKADSVGLGQRLRFF